MCPDPAHLLTRRSRKAFSVARPCRHISLCARRQPPAPSPELQAPHPLTQARKDWGWRLSLGSPRPVGRGRRSGQRAQGSPELRAESESAGRAARLPAAPGVGWFQVFSQVQLSQDNRTSKDGRGSSDPKQTKAGSGGHLGHPVDRVQGQTGLPHRDRALAGLGARHSRLPEGGLGLEAWLQLLGLSTCRALIPGLCVGTAPIPSRGRAVPERTL